MDAAKYCLEISAEAEARLIAGARDTGAVRGLTHGFYKYPARFSPTFARAVIEEFTSPGDLVLDPHVGGGTSLVEALAAGRNAVGVDISTLAEFVSSAKTMVFTEQELTRLVEWSIEVAAAINIHKPSAHSAEYSSLGYYKHLHHPSRWRLRKAIEQALESAVALNCSRLETFGRCAVLRTAQWALDGRKKLPSVDEFREFLQATATAMTAGARALSELVSPHGPAVRVLQRSAAGLETDPRIKAMPAPKLVLTSPPYPGVHVLYHRWQVDGRKESAAPFWIAGKLDGAGGSYYTMGDRKSPHLSKYFSGIQATMSSISAIVDDNTVVAQMVAFSDSSWQLEKYLDTMEAAGLQEAFLPSLANEGDGRLWRSVPRRRWYSDQRGQTPGSQEVVLFHRKGTQPTADSRPSTSLISDRSLSPKDVSVSMNGASALQVDPIRSSIG
jgi:hypothetical protein